MLFFENLTRCLYLLIPGLLGAQRLNRDQHLDILPGQAHLVEGIITGIQNQAIGRNCAVETGKKKSGQGVTLSTVIPADQQPEKKLPEIHQGLGL